MTIKIAKIVNLSRTTTLAVYLGHANSHKVAVLVDNCATINFMSENFIRRHHLRTMRRPCQLHIDFAGVTMEVSTRTAPGISLTFGEYQEKITFEVANINHDIVLGKPWLEDHQAQINITIETVNFSFDHKKFTLGPWMNPHHFKEWLNLIQVVSATTARQANCEIIPKKGIRRLIQDAHEQVYALTVLEEPSEKADTLIPPEVDEVVRPILNEFADVFHESLPRGVSLKHGISHDIITAPGTAPRYYCMCRLTKHELATLQEKIADLLKNNHIRPSSSPYAASVLFAPKKGGTLRMCIDYRALNKQTIKNKYPLPLVDELLDQLQKARYFTKMDLSDGYYHIPITQEHVHKTAFRTPVGHYEFLVMPFGLVNAPATFQRLMNDTFADMRDKFLVIYMDDILIYDSTLELHIKHVRTILQRLRDKGMYVKLKKSSFFQSEVEYLGYRIGDGQVKPDPEKVRAIMEWPTPLPTITAVRSFLGLTQFYKRFIRNFARLAAPLTNLTKSTIPFKWNQEAEQAITVLKEKLVQLPSIYMPNLETPFEIQVNADASGIAVGAVLHQLLKSSAEVPVAYASRKLTEVERRAPVHEQEFFAIHYALVKWRHLLMGREFKLFTDHHALQYFLSQKKLSPKLARMAEFIQQFNMTINYKPGKDNICRRIMLYTYNFPE